ncbi:unnamed protein product [Amoebophrya sp. A25]|nr:unnamed protein product [Amoebophrya sp. A25]|eukprot:GSA25T00003957001.1
MGLGVSDTARLMPCSCCQPQANGLAKGHTKKGLEDATDLKDFDLTSTPCSMIRMKKSTKAAPSTSSTSYTSTSTLGTNANVGGPRGALFFTHRHRQLQQAFLAGVDAESDSEGDSSEEVEEEEVEQSGVVHDIFTSAGVAGEEQGGVVEVHIMTEDGHTNSSTSSSSSSFASSSSGATSPTSASSSSTVTSPQEQEATSSSETTGWTGIFGPTLGLFTNPHDPFPFEQQFRSGTEHLDLVAHLAYRDSLSGGRVPASASASASTSDTRSVDVDSAANNSSAAPGSRGAGQPAGAVGGEQRQAGHATEVTTPASAQQVVLEQETRRSQLHRAMVNARDVLFVAGEALLDAVGQSWVSAEDIDSLYYQNIDVSAGEAPVEEEQLTQEEMEQASSVHLPMLFSLGAPIGTSTGRGVSTEAEQSFRSAGGSAGRSSLPVGEERGGRGSRSPSDSSTLSPTSSVGSTPGSACAAGAGSSSSFEVSTVGNGNGGGGSSIGEPGVSSSNGGATSSSCNTNAAVPTPRCPRVTNSCRPHEKIWLVVFGHGADAANTEVDHEGEQTTCSTRRMFQFLKPWLERTPSPSFRGMLVRGCCLQRYLSSLQSSKKTKAFKAEDENKMKSKKSSKAKVPLLLRRIFLQSSSTGL